MSEGRKEFAARIHKVERQLLLRQMAVSAALLLAFAAVVVAIFYHQEYRALEGRLEVLTLAVVESVEDEHDTPYFDHSQFLGTQAPNPDDQRIQWLDLTGQNLADRGSFPIEDEDLISRGLTEQRVPRPALVNVVMCYDDHVPKQPYGFVRVALSLEPLQDRMKRLLSDLGFGLLLALFLAAGFSRYMAVQALKPMWTAYRQISQFTADAAHELRNPLAAVLCNVGLLKEQGPQVGPSDLEESLDNIEDAANQMTHLVEGLLTLARASDLGLDAKVRVALGPLVRRVTEGFAAQAGLREIRLECQIDEVDVNGDEVLLAVVVSNLVQNALRHSDEGDAIDVRVKRFGSHAGIEVQDTGGGISEVDLERVFERFWRADQARTHGTGTGLGLALVKGIAEAHGGRVELESRIGEGSLFRVLLPTA